MVTISIEPALTLADLLRAQVDDVVLEDLRDGGQAAGRTCMHVCIHLNMICNLN